MGVGVAPAAVGFDVACGFAVLEACVGAVVVCLTVVSGLLVVCLTVVSGVLVVGFLVVGLLLVAVIFVVGAVVDLGPLVAF